jgi:ribonuclease J
MGDPSIQLPLSTARSDIERLKKAGDEGVLLLMSESTGADKNGRTSTEHTLQQSFVDLIANANGRVFVSIFSSLSQSDYNLIFLFISIYFKDFLFLFFDSIIL